MLVGTAEWVNPLIAGIAGVGGAVVGAGALIWVNSRTERSKRELERRAAFVDFYGAANSFALMYHVWSEMQLGTSWLAQLRLGIRMYGYTKTFMTRLWHVQDAFWQSSGRARSVATAEELATLDGIESVIADWKIGYPIPEAWGPAIRELRALMERRGELEIG